MEVYYTIYQTTNLVNGKFYIGKHQTKNLDDNYIGSGAALKKAIKKYGRKNFKKEILFIFKTEHEMNVKEKEIVNESFFKNEMTYNIGVGGEGGSHFKGKNHSDEMKEALSKKMIGRKLTKEQRNKISEANRGRVLSEETKKKLSEKAKQRFASQEERDKISNSLKNNNKKLTDEQKAKISEKAKIREANKRNNIAG
jgi:hypothetical protein